MVLMHKNYHVASFKGHGKDDQPGRQLGYKTLALRQKINPFPPYTAGLPVGLWPHTYAAPRANSPGCPHSNLSYTKIDNIHGKNPWNKSDALLTQWSYRWDYEYTRPFRNITSMTSKGRQEEANIHGEKQGSKRRLWKNMLDASVEKNRESIVARHERDHSGLVSHEDYDYCRLPSICCVNQLSAPS